MAYIKQTWSDNSTGGTPITAARLNHMETGIKSVSDSVDSLSDSVDSLSNVTTETLLWENASPTSNFAAQTVSISNLQTYNYIRIVSKSTTGTKMDSVVYVPTTVNTEFNIASTTGVYRGNRNCLIKSNSIQFNDGVYYSSYGSSSTTTLASYCIPVYVYGIKVVN